MSTNPILDLESSLVSVKLEFLMSRRFNGKNGWSLLRKKGWHIFEYLHSRVALLPQDMIVTAHKVVDASFSRTISAEEMAQWYSRQSEEPVSPDLLALVLAHTPSFDGAKNCFATMSPGGKFMFYFVQKGTRNELSPLVNQIEVYQSHGLVYGFSGGDVYFVTSKPAPLEAP